MLPENIETERTGVGYEESGHSVVRDMTFSLATIEMADTFVSISVPLMTFSFLGIDERSNSQRWNGCVFAFRYIDDRIACSE